MIDPTVLRAMLEAGCTAEQIVSVAEEAARALDEKKAAKKAKDADRQRRHRASRNVTDVTRDKCDIPSPKESFPQTPFKEITPTQSEANASSKRGTRLPTDFVCDVALAETLGLSKAEAEQEAAKFRDYWTAQPGQKGVKTDWLATWRNWCRTAAERRKPPQRNNSPPSQRRNYADVAMDRMRNSNGTESIFGGDGDVELLPPGGREPGPDAEHIRGGVAGRYIPGRH